MQINNMCARCSAQNKYFQVINIVIRRNTLETYIEPKSVPFTRVCQARVTWSAARVISGGQNIPIGHH